MCDRFGNSGNGVDDLEFLSQDHIDAKLTGQI